MNIKNLTAKLPVVTQNRPCDYKINFEDHKWNSTYAITLAGDSDEFFWQTFPILIANHNNLYHARVNFNSSRRTNVLAEKQGNNLVIYSNEEFPHIHGEVDIKVHSAKEVEIKNEFKDNLPFTFFDFNGEHIKLEGLYKNAHIFVISSGPSFKDFPYKDKLKFVMTVGLNNSPKAMMPYCRPNIYTHVDHPSKFSYMTWADPQTLKIVPEGHRDKCLWNNDTKKNAGFKTKDCPNTVFVRRNSIFNPDTWLTETSINWGNNEKITAANGVNGKRSVLVWLLKILYVLGFRSVYLLGVDFNMSETNKYSFNEKRSTGAISGNNASYKQMEYFFQVLQPKLQAAGFNVFNCNKDSALKVFPYLSFHEAFIRALSHCHNPIAYTENKLEDTYGLYESTWIECPKCKKEAMIDKEELKNYKCSCGQILTKDNKKKGG